MTWMAKRKHVFYMPSQLQDPSHDTISWLEDTLRLHTYDVRTLLFVLEK
jgi:hypothetical protein